MIWIDAHPDVSTPQNGYPNPHAMVLGSLLGGGVPQLRELMDHPAFDPADILYMSGCRVCMIIRNCSSKMPACRLKCRLTAS